MVILARDPFIPQGRSADDDFDLYMTACEDLGRLASDVEFGQWLASIDGHYEDEPPTLDESAYYEPDPEDVAWLAQQREDELSLLLSQRDDCAALPLTLANLDRRVAELREGGVGC